MRSKTFYDLELKDSIIKAIDNMGFEEPSKIQEEVIPVLIEGYDVIGQAQTGTGKTLAFGAPILNNLTSSPGRIKCIIITPTRELSIQVNDELNRIGKYTGLKLLPVYGGQPIERQISAIKRGIDIVVGTPGRVLDLMRRRIIDLSHIEFFVLDEADEMLDMGFIDDIEEIIKSCSIERQTMLFSATMPDEIRNLAKKYMAPNTKHISILKSTMTVATVSQYYYEVKQKDRFESLCRILDVDEPTSAIIFCKTKKGVDELVEALDIRGYDVEGMHGDMNQNQRLGTLRKFKEGNLEFLVATDVAARGIDVENVSHVINYDLPQDTDSYVHRIGRTGRANKEGTAYTLVTAKEYYILKQIEKGTKSKIRRKEIPSMDEIFLSKYKTIISKIKETIQKDEHKRFVSLAVELDEEYNLIDVAAALMNMVLEKELAYNYTENKIGSYTNYARLFLSIGKMDKINSKVLLQFFSDAAKVDKDNIGDIDIMQKFSFVDATQEAAKSIIKHCSGKRLLGRKVKIEMSKPK